MLSDDFVETFRSAVRDCNEARQQLESALDDASAHGNDATADSSVLKAVAETLADWRDAQQRFMSAVEASGVPDPATAALLLKTNHGIDAANARCGLPGTNVEGADQPSGLDLSGARGSVLTTAATDYL